MVDVSIENVGSLERKMTVTVPASKIENEVKSRLRDVGRKVKLKGFRPGKVPANVVEQRYGSEVRNEVMTEIIQKSYVEALEQEKIHPAGAPKIEPQSIVLENDFSFIASFEVFPAIEVNDVQKLKIEKPLVEITDANVDDVIERMRMQNVEWTLVKRAAQDKDRVTCAVKATIGDEPLFEQDTLEVVIGTTAVAPDFDQKLVGKKAGDNAEFDIQIPETDWRKEIAGKTVSYVVDVKHVDEPKLPELDDEFCKNFDVEEGGVEALKAAVKENMGKELDQRVTATVRGSLVDAFLDANPVELPSAVVHEEMHRLQADAARRLGVQDKAQWPQESLFEPQAKKNVAFGLLVDACNKQKLIEATDEAIEKKINEVAERYSKPEEIVNAYRTNPNLMMQLKSIVLEDALVDWLLEQAKVKEFKQGFDEIMSQSQ